MREIDKQTHAGNLVNDYKHTVRVWEVRVIISSGSVVFYPKAAGKMNGEMTAVHWCN